MFVEYLCNRCPKIKTKNIKNYGLILATVNHRNWLDDSLPLIYYTTKIYYCTTLNRFYPIGVLSIKQVNLFQMACHPKHGVKEVLSHVDRYTTLFMSFQYACFGLIFQIDVSLSSFLIQF